MAPAHTPMVEKPSPLTPIDSFTKQLIHSLYQESLTSIFSLSVSPVPLMQLINHFLPLKTFLRVHPFSCFFLCFHCTFFRWLTWSLLEPHKYFSSSLFMHSLFSLITRSFLNGFQSNLYQRFSHVQYNLPVKLFSKHLNVFVKRYYITG